MTRNNIIRAGWVERTMAAFCAITGVSLVHDREDAVADLLCDLRHYCDLRELDFADLDRRARHNYLHDLDSGEDTWELEDPSPIAADVLSKVVKDAIDEVEESSNALGFARGDNGSGSYTHSDIEQGRRDVKRARDELEKTLRIVIEAQTEIAYAKGVEESCHQVGDESELRAAAERMVQTYRDWMAGCDNGARTKDVEAAHINLRDTLAKLRHQSCTQRIRIETTVGGHLAVTLLPSGASALFRSTGEIGEALAHSLPNRFEAPIGECHQVGRNVEALVAPARELLALYDWRPEIAKLEATLKRDGTDAQDTVRDVRRMLREYGERKKAGWIALRAALADYEFVARRDAVSVPREVLDFFEFASTVFVPFTAQQEELMLSLRKARVAMGLPEHRFGECHAI